MAIVEVWSGGQTGVDRAALDAALEVGLPIGGWIPLGRRAEDGTIPARYGGLVETESPDYPVRTERNVRDTDATLILSVGPFVGGTALTREIALAQSRPVLVLDLAAMAAADAVERARRWAATLPARTRLNVAGPRASEAPTVYAVARSVLTALLRRDSGSDATAG